MTSYLKMSLETSLDELGISLTDQQIDDLAESLEVWLDNQSLNAPDPLA